LDDAEAPPGAKVAAARAVLDFALAGKEPAPQRGELGPEKSDLGPDALQLEPTLPEGRVTLLEQASVEQPTQPLHGA